MTRADREGRTIIEDLRAARMRAAADLVERGWSERRRNTPS